MHIELTLGAQNPGNSPSGKSEALGETIDDENIVLVDILNVLSSRDGGTITVAGVVVTRVELVADKGGTVTANVLNLGKFGVGNDTAGRVARVGGQDDRGTTGNFLSDLIRVDMISILFRQRDRDGSELDMISQIAALCCLVGPNELTFLKRLSISL